MIPRDAPIFWGEETAIIANFRRETGMNDDDCMIEGSSVALNR